MRPSTPLVSVITPAFNAEATLEDAVRSALASSYAKIELIVVDDGSTDRTAEIARDLASEDQRVKLVQRPNGGLAAALNSGFAASSGDYVARLDADDLWHPAKLERQMDVARREPDAGLIYTFFRYIDEDGCVLGDGPQQRFPPRALCRSVYETLIGTGSSGLVKRSAWQQAGGCDEELRIMEDLLLQLHISARHPIAYVPEYLVGYRVRQNSLSKDVEALESAWRKVRDRIGTMFPDVPPHVIHWAHGSRIGQMAESYAWRGRYGRCAAMLAEAFWHDPAWTISFLSYRIWRSIGRRLQAEEKRPGPHFMSCDPEIATGLVQFGIAAEGGLLRRLNERRIRRLARLDEALAPMQVTGLPPAGDGETIPAEHGGSSAS